MRMEEVQFRVLHVGAFFTGKKVTLVILSEDEPDLCSLMKGWSESNAQLAISGSGAIIMLTPSE